LSATSAASLINRIGWLATLPHPTSAAKPALLIPTRFLQDCNEAV